MIDEEFYLGKKENAEPPSSPEPMPEPSLNEEPEEKEPLGDAEVKVRLSKKTKLMYLAIFCVLICATLAGGLLLAEYMPKKTEKPFEMPEPNSTAAQLEITVPSGTVPAESESTTAPAAPSATAPATVPLTTGTVQQSAAAATTTEPITMFNINSEEFSRLGKILYGLGFVYNPEQNMFYSQNDPWQRNLGYTSFYDDISVLGNMYFDTVRFTFKYGDKKWMYQIWKGRYGATSGCEMGVYYQDRRTDNKQFYDVPTDADPLPGMYFELYRYEDFMFKNGPATHWWLTGFRLLESAGSDALHMKCKYYMPNKEMCDAFEAAVKEQCDQMDNLSYARQDNVISLDWAY